ncbi:MAG: DUF1292 domain-containing protein [Kyrpidia tusciae]|nr:DUF1292 domain-containing protein [Kyrpidia tusciae]MBE3552514.1 DUF1292 domain-containing protein [Kyrpidia tusciae]
MAAYPEKEHRITLRDDEGREGTYDLADILEVHGRTYAILLPVDDILNTEGVVYRLDPDEGGGIAFAPVEDDEEWQAVVDAFNASLFEEE